MSRPNNPYGVPNPYNKSSKTNSGPYVPSRYQPIHTTNDRVNINNNIHRDNDVNATLTQPGQTVNQPHQQQQHGNAPGFNPSAQQQQQRTHQNKYQQRQPPQQFIPQSQPQQIQQQQQLPTVSYSQGQTQPHHGQPNPSSTQPNQQAPAAAPSTPQDIIASLRRQLEEKEEENFDLSASLSAVQVETDDRIKTVEQESKQSISKLEEDLRRAQQDANRLRAALKKQQQQAQQQLQQQQQLQEAAKAQAAARPQTINNDVKLKPSTHPNSGTVTTKLSPSPSMKHPINYASKPSNSDPMDVDFSGSTRGKESLPPPSSVTLVEQLLHSISSQDDESNLRGFLSQQLTAHLNPQKPQDITWGLVQQSVDYHEPEALFCLHQALLLSPDSCQMLVQAAGWETSEEDAMVDELDCASVFPNSSTIRLGLSSTMQQRHLASIVSNLNQSLALSQSLNPPPSTTATPNISSCTPKQTLLARQLMIQLSKAVDPDCSSMPLRDAMRVLVQLLSCIRQPVALEKLEPIMMRLVPRMELYRSQSEFDSSQKGGKLVRGYDTLQACCINTQQDESIMEVDSAVGGNIHRSPSDSDASAMEPVLCELCCQITRLLPDMKQDEMYDDQSKSTLDFVHQWKKIVLANACDMLESSLMPFLSDAGSPSKENNVVVKQPPAGFLETWQAWIPWFTLLVEDAPGRQLLRVQFPMTPHKTAAAVPQLRRISSVSSTETDSTCTQRKRLSCSTIGLIVKIFYAAVTADQTVSSPPTPFLQDLCTTLRDQSIRFLQAWLQAPDVIGPGGELTFMTLVSEYSDHYKSACAWLLHQHETKSNMSTCTQIIDQDIYTMVKDQIEELMIDEEDALTEPHDRYDDMH